MTRTQVNRRHYKKLAALNWLFSLAAAAILVLLIFSLWFTGIKVADGGMSPALYQGDVILFDRLAKHISLPKRGDVYAFENDGTSIGRIAALPGDTVAIKAGQVYIGGCLLREVNASDSDWELDEFTVPASTFLILPDDRTASIPDRDALLIPFNRLIGRAAVRVAPISMAAIFTN